MSPGPITVPLAESEAGTPATFQGRSKRPTDGAASACRGLIAIIIANRSTRRMRPLTTVSRVPRTGSPFRRARRSRRLRFLPFRRDGRGFTDPRHSHRASRDQQQHLHPEQSDRDEQHHRQRRQWWRRGHRRQRERAGAQHEPHRRGRVSPDGWCVRPGLGRKRVGRPSWSSSRMRTGPLPQRIRAIGGSERSGSRPAGCQTSGR